jgi:hypothetical protein
MWLSKPVQLMAARKHRETDRKGPGTYMVPKDMPPSANSYLLNFYFLPLIYSAMNPSIV